MCGRWCPGLLNPCNLYRTEVQTYIIGFLNGIVCLNQLKGMAC